MFNFFEPEKRTILVSMIMLHIKLRLFKTFGVIGYEAHLLFMCFYLSINN